MVSRTSQAIYGADTAGFSQDHPTASAQFTTQPTPRTDALAAASMAGHARRDNPSGGRHPGPSGRIVVVVQARHCVVHWETIHEVACPSDRRLDVLV
jgi:hypothetical protein